MELKKISLILHLVSMDEAQHHIKQLVPRYLVRVMSFLLSPFSLVCIFDQTKPLIEDKAKLKSFGQPIQYWGNQENRLGRKSYGEIRQFLFAALVAKTDIELIALDKGEITARKVVDQLVDKMEQYANLGFSYIYEKMEEDPNYFFKETAFLKLFLSFLNDKKEDEEQLEEI